MAKRKGEGASAPVDDYVGYGNPPKEHRFREGTVPNPWGRKGKPKPKLDFLEEKQRVRIDGQWKWITRGEAIDHALYKEAMAGNVSAAKQLEARHSRRLAQAAREREDAQAAEDQAALQRYLERHQADGREPLPADLADRMPRDPDPEPGR